MLGHSRRFASAEAECSLRLAPPRSRPDARDWQLGADGVTVLWVEVLEFPVR